MRKYRISDNFSQNEKIMFLREFKAEKGDRHPWYF